MKLLMKHIFTLYYSGDPKKVCEVFTYVILDDEIIESILENINDNIAYLVYSLHTNNMSSCVESIIQTDISRLTNINDIPKIINSIHSKLYIAYYIMQHSSIYTEDNTIYTRLMDDIDIDTIYQDKLNFFYKKKDFETMKETKNIINTIYL